MDGRTDRPYFTGPFWPWPGVSKSPLNSPFKKANIYIKERLYTCNFLILLQDINFSKPIFDWNLIWEKEPTVKQMQLKYGVQWDVSLSKSQINLNNASLNFEPEREKSLYIVLSSVS